MAHTCHAIGCERAVPPAMFMCRPDWFSLPKHLRDAIWHTYRPGQCDDWRPSAAYCKAAKEAVLWLAAKRRIAVAADEPKVKLYDVFAPEND